MSSQRIRTRIIRITILPVVVMLVLLMGLKWTEALDDTQQQLRIYAEQASSQLVTASEVYLNLGNHEQLQRHIERLVAQPEIEAIAVSAYASKATLTAETHEGARDTTRYARYLKGLVSMEHIVWKRPIRQQVINPFDYYEATEQESIEAAAIGSVKLVLNPYSIADRNVRGVLYHLLISLAGVALIMLFTVMFARRLATPLTRLAERSERVRRRAEEETGFEDLPTTIAKDANEIEVLESGFNHMVATLETAKQDLEQRVQSATARIQTLLEETSRIAEREKRALANELHDELGQALVKLKWQAIGIRDVEKTSIKEIRERGVEILDGIDRIYARVNSIINRLHPEELETLGLRMALQKNVEEWNMTNRTCEYTLSLQKENIDQLDSEISLIVYRIVQESLTNATKHAQATRVAVTIGEDPTTNELQLGIVDDGIGFDPEGIGPACRGIKTMRERAAAFGGNFVVVTQPGAGTTIEVTIPANSNAFGED